MGRNLHPIWKIMSVITPPIPVFQNLPIEPQFYQPSQFFISAISLGVTTIVTATTNMNYIVGQLVRILIPNGFGTRQLNEQLGYVISLPAGNQVEVNINSAAYDPFKNNALLTTKAQILAVGDNNSGIISSTGRVIPTTNIPGSFINISPNI
jgi:hypothetical protein